MSEPFHPLGDANDDPAMYSYSIGRLYLNGKPAGWIWRCDCDRCVNTATGPFRTEAAASKNADAELRAQFPGIKFTDGGHMPSA